MLDPIIDAFDVLDDDKVYDAFKDTIKILIDDVKSFEDAFEYGDDLIASIDKLKGLIEEAKEASDEEELEDEEFEDEEDEEEELEDEDSEIEEDEPIEEDEEE